MLWHGMKTAPRKPDVFFLIRPTDINPDTGTKYVPSVVHKMNGKFYPMTTDKPLDFGHQKMEWHEIPD